MTLEEELERKKIEWTTEGFEECFKKSFEEGFKKGFEEGFKKGFEETEVKAILKLYSKNYTPEQIAEMFNFEISYVKKVLNIQ